MSADGYVDRASFGNSRTAADRRSAGSSNLKLSYDLSAILTVLAAIAIARIVALSFNATDLYTDESQYWAWSRELTFGYFSKPPLIAWIIAMVTPVCGDGEFCVRLPSVFMHLATSLVIYFIGLRLVSPETGFWSALVFATLPGVSLSSGIISTDVPLLIAWSLALWAFSEFLRKPDYTLALALGLALGLGLNAKYAMAFFFPCAALYFVISPEKQDLLKRRHLWIALAVSAALIAPNVWWNANHGFATYFHTAGNANWTGSLAHPDRAMEFVISQFGVFGPIFFAALLTIAWKRPSGSFASATERLLIAFSVPIIVAVTIQAFLSRSLANWAAPAYVAASLLVVHTMIRTGAWHWLFRGLGLNAAIGLVIALATAHAGSFMLPGGSDPFARTLGFRDMVDELRVELLDVVRGTDGPVSLLTDDRDLTAALLYYGRDFNMPIYVWPARAAPRNHFELNIPFNKDAPQPILLISSRADGSGIPSRFSGVRSLGQVKVEAGKNMTRTVHLFQLSAFKGGLR